jgi:hypothetical protein
VERVAAAALLIASISTSAVFAPVDLPDVRRTPTVERTHQIATIHPDDARLEMDARLLASVARAEDPEAPTAVMWVVKNRAIHWYRGDLTRAVTDGEAFGTRYTRGPNAGKWVPISLNWPRTPRMMELEALAYKVLLGQRRDPTGGATHFHRVGTWEPPWAPPLNMRKVFGAHYFYKAVKPVSPN